MVSILAVIHIVLSVFLVLLVLIQDPKGGSVGGMFGGGGGGSNSLFGATGAPTFLAQVTRWMAVVFAGSCIAMTIFIKPKEESVLDTVSIPKNEESKATENPENKFNALTGQSSPESGEKPNQEIEKDNKSSLKTKSDQTSPEQSIPQPKQPEQ